MSVAAKQLRRKRVWLKERQDRITAGTVDREKRIIHGVKILGLESSNGRRYTEEALRAAVPLYEGAKVKADHPRKPGEQRSVRDTLGWYVGVEFRPGDGLYAREFHYLESHPMSATICEAAERNPGLFGFSHNVQGDTAAGPDGVEVVYEIVEVRSVDLVDDPATTNGLFESKRMKLRTLLESLELPGKGKALKAKNKLLVKLFESGVMDAEMDAPLEPPAEDVGAAGHAEALKGGFEAAIGAVVSDCLSGGDCKAGIKKIGEMLKSHEKLSADGTPVEEEEDEDLEEEEDEDLEEECDEEDKPMKESRELKLLRAEKRGRQLCEEAGVACDSVLLESLSRLDEKGMKRLIERERARGTPGPQRQQPRAGSGGGKKGGEGAARTDDIAEFMAAARS